MPEHQQVEAEVVGSDSGPGVPHLDDGMTRVVRARGHPELVAVGAALGDRLRGVEEHVQEHLSQTSFVADHHGNRTVILDDARAVLELVRRRVDVLRASPLDLTRRLSDERTTANGSACPPAWDRIASVVEHTVLPWRERTMLQAFVITLREGIEAFLIVAITLAYLRKIGRGELARYVYLGIGAAVMVSVAAGVLFSRAENQSLWEGVLALAAAVTVATLTVQMWRSGRRMRQQIEAGLERHAARAGRAAAAGILLFTAFMIAREGMETALLFGALLLQVRSIAAVGGAIIGLAAAATVAWLWARYGHRVNLARFLQVTAIFLLLFVAQLVVYGFHELTEAGVVPNSEALHRATEPYGPDGEYGRHANLFLVLLPLGWLGMSTLIERRRPDASQREPASSRPPGASPSPPPPRSSRRP